MLVKSVKKKFGMKRGSAHVHDVYNAHVKFQMDCLETVGGNARLLLQTRRT